MFFPLVERQENYLGNFPIHRMNTSSHLLRSNKKDITMFISVDQAEISD